MVAVLVLVAAVLWCGVEGHSSVCAVARSWMLSLQSDGQSRAAANPKQLTCSEN